VRHTLNRHRPRKRAIQYSETPMMESKSRGVLDTPPSRSMAASVRSGTTKQSILSLRREMDCFAEPVIGRRFAPTRWLAMTAPDAHSRDPLAHNDASFCEGSSHYATPHDRRLIRKT
jgi:hypothetical protein